VRKNVARIAGGFQCVAGVLSSVFSYMIYVNAWIREELSIEQEEIALFMFIFLVFGVLSIASGMILLRENC
jgi:hypothetical protein